MTAKPTRTPAVAGLFYPDDPDTLRKMVADMTPTKEPQEALAIMAPHAGYVYSGGVAGATFAEVEIPQTVLILSPKHTRMGAYTSINTQGHWEIPGSQVSIDELLANHLLEYLPQVVEDDAAHAKEHGVEVLLPFLQHRRPDVKFVPIVFSYRSLEHCKAMGKALGEALDQWAEPVLIIISSDMNHFEDEETTQHKDHQALQELLALQPENLHQTCLEQNISMCGVVPATIALYALQPFGCTQARLVEHTTSAAVSGNTQRVVGYAGVVFS